jgi:O-succinylbenzoate synthase
LPGLNEEDMSQVTGEIAGLKADLTEQELPDDLDLLTGGFDRWLKPWGLAPSVRWGLETAITGLIAQRQKIPLCRLISDSPRAEVTVNALLAGDYKAVLSRTVRLLDEGYGAFKLKVGQCSVADAVRIVLAVRERVGPAAILRLDANRAWDVDQTMAVIQSLSNADIDYLEEPVQTDAMLADLLSRSDMRIPLALDESLVRTRPDDISFPPNLGAVVLKPTRLGLEKTVRLARRATRQGVRAVISSSFESGFGLQVLSHLAASVNDTDVPAGLGTASWLKTDLVANPPRIQNGRLPVVDLPDSFHEFKGELLE